MNKDWFILTHDNTIISIGECEDFDDADEKACDAIWIFSPETINSIYESLKTHFGD